MALGIADATLQTPQVLILGEGRQTEPQPAFLICKIREERRGHFCDSGWGTPDGRSGCEREIFVSDFAKTDCEVGWICNLWLSSRE